MKNSIFLKVLACALICVMASSYALADTVTIDLEAASAEELKAARDAIDAKLMDIRLANAPKPDDAYIIKGSGTQILTNVEINAELSRFNVHYLDEAKLSLFDNNGKQLYIKGYIEGKQVIPTIMLESEEEWSIDVSPLSTNGSPYISGRGSYTSDLFVVTPPTIVTITVKDIESYFNYTDISLYYVNKIGTVCFEERFGNILPDKSFDYIIKPNSEAVSWFWVIDCSNHVEWSISAK